MHWQAVGGTVLTDGQGLVLRGHPHVDPSAGGRSAKVHGPAGALSAEALAEVLGLPEDWCATCARLRTQGRR